MGKFNKEIPNPIIDTKELNAVEELTNAYNKMLEPGIGKKIGNKVGKVIPEKVKNKVKDVGKELSEKEIYTKMMEYVGEGFKVIEENAAKFSISEKDIIKRINKKSNYKIDKLSEVCLVRSYDIGSVVSSYKTQDIIIACTEGAATGAPGFWGLPFNIVLSMFLYFRAVQTIAMFYGYDIKNDPAEMIIAGDVFTQALNPSDDSVENEKGILIGKIMIMSQLEVTKDVVKKGWTEAASRGGIPLLITQIRALAHKSAKKALEKAGKKGLENTIFRETFETIGKKVTQQSVGKLVHGVGAFFGALIDSAQMNQVIKYANIFYQKRFIAEKELRIKMLVDNANEVEIIETNINED